MVLNRRSVMFLALITGVLGLAPPTPAQVIRIERSVNGNP